MGVKVVSEWLHSCSGCEIAILNIGEELLDLLERVELVHIPVLMDKKYFGQTGQENDLDIPEADVALVSGGVANDEHLEVLERVRSRCNFLIALGTCATHGGIPSLLNQWTKNEALETIYSTSTTDECDIPSEGIPKMLDRVYALDEQVKVDLLVPGCPPNSEHIASVLKALISGKSPTLPDKSVCDTCPTIRKGKGDVKEVKRFLENANFTPGEPLERMRCLLEQGFMCMGPVTAAGCAVSGAPKCISARVPCRGCYGPVRFNGNQLLDMMNALASNGIEWRSIEDKRSLLRFSGAHGFLRPLNYEK